MGELIYGRTPEDIKRELRWAAFTCGSINCEDCEYYESICSHTTDERLAPDALALIEHLEAKVPKWISVEERLPDTTNVYLIHIVHRYNKNDGYRSMDVRMFFKDEFEPWQGLPDIYEVTHWMPMPEPPEEDE